MKKLFLPFTLILFLASCSGGNTESNDSNKEASDSTNTASVNTEDKLDACQCAKIYLDLPTVKQTGEKEENKDENKKRADQMWEPCKYFENNNQMSEVLKCAERLKKENADLKK